MPDLAMPSPPEAARIPAPPRPKPAAPRAVKNHRGKKTVQAVTILRNAEELFQHWRRLENLPDFVPDLISVNQISRTESHWGWQSAGGQLIEWDAEIINEHPNGLIAWRTRPGALIPHAGSVRFERAPAERGTEVTVALEYDPPGGRVGAMLSKLTGRSAERQVAEALRRFKSLMETGEIATLEGQPQGPRRPRRNR